MATRQDMMDPERQGLDPIRAMRELEGVDGAHLTSFERLTSVEDAIQYGVNIADIHIAKLPSSEKPQTTVPDAVASRVAGYAREASDMAQAEQAKVVADKKLTVEQYASDGSTMVSNSSEHGILNKQPLAERLENSSQTVVTQELLDEIHNHYRMN